MKKLVSKREKSENSADYCTELWLMSASKRSMDAVNDVRERLSWEKVVRV